MYNRNKKRQQSLMDIINNPSDKIKQQPKPPYREVEPIEKGKDLVEKVLAELSRKSDGVPTFVYPFKRKNNTTKKTKTDQELYEEILFTDKETQYLFNKSGLFHGGVHLKAEAFDKEFKVEEIRAIADGELVFYRIDKKYLTNTLIDECGDEYEVKYSTGFFLLEHKMEYPKGNHLKFYSLYMHTAPSYAYEFIEHGVMGQSAYARKTSDNSNADDVVKFGDKVVLGKPIPKKDGRYELLAVNGVKAPSGINVHILNLIPKMVTTTVTGSKPNMRKGNTNSQKSSPTEGLLKDKSSITVNAYQTEEQKKNKRYQILKAIKLDGTSAVLSSKSTISASNLKDKIKKADVFTSHDNGVVLPHMKELAGSNLKPASNIKVKAGDTLGYLGVYNYAWGETELDKVVHLEVFTFDDLKGFIEKAKKEYAKKQKDLSDEEKKLRPKENTLIVKKDAKRYIKEVSTTKRVVKLNQDDPLREGVNSHKSKKLRNKELSSGVILSIKPTASVKKRYEVISIDEGESDFTVEEKKKTWSVYKDSVDEVNVFTEVVDTRTDVYIYIKKPLKKLKELKDKDDKIYLLVDKKVGVDIYVKEKDVEKTHGITFPNFKLIDEAGADKIGIFEEVSKYYVKDIEEDETPQQEKELLNATFKKILKEIKVDKDENGNLEAGEFASLSLTKEKRKELSYMMVKHVSEWEHEKEKFEPILDHMSQDPNLKEQKEMFEERLFNLAFFPKDIVGKGQVPTFIHPIALLEGFVGSSCYCGRDFTVDEVKNIVEKLRDSGGISSTDLFTMNNCTLADSDKTYERFTEELNAMMTKYKINTCIRKIHFLAQAYHETDKFRTTQEYASGKGYNPGQHADARKNGNTIIGDGPKYKGRGLMQLTWKNNYKSYKNACGVDIVTNYSYVSDKLYHVVDSAGWFWENGSAWGSLNKRADKDDIYWINMGVNGGVNGFQDRIDYVKLLIKIMNVKSCNNIKLPTNKTLGIYKLSLSALRLTNYIKYKNKSGVQTHKIKMESYDD